MTGDRRGTSPRATLLRSARLVPVRSAAPSDSPVDVRIVDGVVTEVSAGLELRPGELVLDAGGRWALPGLWDHHVHMTQWARTRVQLDLTGSADAGEVLDRLTRHVAGLPGSAAAVLGYGYRSGSWRDRPTVAALDAAVADRPVVLISGDAHNGWLNSRALQLFGVPPVAGPLDENEWFPVFARLPELPLDRAEQERAYREAVAAAASLGVVGIVDMEFGAGYADWPRRIAEGIDGLRVRPAVYPEGLDDVIASGLRTGQVLEATRRVTMGPLKIISDGSLNTRTASCCEPFVGVRPDEHPFGKQNYDPGELTALLTRAREHGLEAAVHAIGDAAATIALDAFEESGATGSIEHAQLMRFRDIERMGRLGVRGSVQPAHLLDDRGISELVWPDRLDRCFALRSMVGAGVALVLGSDAPVAPLDPWLAMAAAVHRGLPDDPAWNPAEALTRAEALAASTDGQPTLAPGGRGDVVLLDHDPLAPAGDSASAATVLRGVRVAATLVAGRPTYLAPGW